MMLFVNVVTMDVFSMNRAGRMSQNFCSKLKIFPWHAQHLRHTFQYVFTHARCLARLALYPSPLNPARNLP